MVREALRFKVQCLTSFYKIKPKGSRKTKDPSKYLFIALMIDGVKFRERTLVVALGITKNCQKVALGLREGDTENLVVNNKDLLTSIQERRFKLHRDRLLAFADGLKAIKKVFRDIFRNSVIVQIIT